MNFKTFCQSELLIIGFINIFQDYLDHVASNFEHSWTWLLQNYTYFRSIVIRDLL